MFSSLMDKQNVGRKNLIQKDLYKKKKGTESNFFIYTQFIIIQQFQHQPFPSNIVGEVLLMKLTKSLGRFFFFFLNIYSRNP